MDLNSRKYPWEYDQRAYNTDRFLIYMGNNSTKVDSRRKIDFERGKALKQDAGVPKERSVNEREKGTLGF